MEELTPPQADTRQLPQQRWRKFSRQILKKSVPIITGALGALVILVLFNLLTSEPDLLTPGDVDNSIAEAMASATPAPPYSTLVYQLIQPSLVLIQTQIPGEDGELGQGIGSGVVINDSGEILTSLHVVENAAEIELLFADGTNSPGEVITSQPENDIAVLRAVLPPLLVIPAVLGNPNALRVGDEAFVVGNPLGLYSSLSAGVISGFNRSFEPQNGDRKLEGLIQIDAAVNPGNSGGPLLNRYGQVVGIITALANPTDTDVFIGIGFAVPIDVAGGAANLPPY